MCVLLARTEQPRERTCEGFFCVLKHVPDHPAFFVVPDGQNGSASSTISRPSPVTLVCVCVCVSRVFECTHVTFSQLNKVKVQLCFYILLNQTRVCEDN